MDAQEGRTLTCQLIHPNLSSSKTRIAPILLQPRIETTKDCDHLNQDHASDTIIFQTDFEINSP